MFGATIETYKECALCDRKIPNNVCLCDIMVAERHYIYQQYK